MRRKLLLQLTLLAFATSGSLHVSGQLSGQYQQDFEGPFPPSGWQVKNVLDPSYTWVKTTAQHHSGTHSAYVHYSSDASIQAEDWLILPKFTVAASDSFSFWLAAQFVNYVPDSTVILVSITDSNLSSFTNVIGVLSEPNTYPAVANVFEYYSFSLGAYAGQNIFVALKNRNKDGDGLYVDLVTIGTPPPALSVAAVSVDVPDSVSLIPFSPMGTVKNNSDATQTFPVTMTITGGYSSTMNVTNLDPGELQQITFDPWTHAAGVATITMETQLPTDTIPSDNITSKVVMAIDTDVAAVSIDVPVYVSNLSSIIPRATVKNYSLTVESFSITMNITGGYTSTKNVTNLAPGARQQIDFDVWAPASGVFTVSVQTQLASDVIPADDTLSKVVSAVPPISGYYQEDFEGTFPPFGWQTLDVLDPSEVWVQNTDIPYSGIYDTYMSYSPIDVQGEDWLILPQWSVTAADSFSFWFAVSATGFEPDSTDILVSTTDAYPSSFTDTVGILREGVGGNYPTSLFTYKYYSFSLAAYAGQNIYVALRNRNIYGDGIYVDHVTIGSPLVDLDAKAISIDMPDVVSTVSAFTPQATVKNNSLTSQSFSVAMTIPGGYSSTKNVTNLASGTAQQIDFDPWTPAAGAATVSIQTQLAGDEDPTNDTLSKLVTAFDPLSGYYQEDFEGAFPPVAWQTLDVLGPDAAWMQSQDEAYSGSNSAFINYQFPGQGEDWLILPQFTVASTDSLSFWLAINFTPYVDSTSILVSTTDADPSSFTTVLATLSDGVNYPTIIDSFQYYAYSLSAFAGQNIYVALKNRNTNGDGVFIDLLSIGTPLGTGITQNIPVTNDLSSFPNPFSKFTSISFSLDQPSAVNISIVDVMGKEVAVLCDKTLPAGAQQITWNASGYSAGVYFCKIILNGNVTTQKLVKLN